MKKFKKWKLGIFEAVDSVAQSTKPFKSLKPVEPLKP